MKHMTIIAEVDAERGLIATVAKGSSLKELNDRQIMLPFR
jgi:hypothetical protein